MSLIIMKILISERSNVVEKVMFFSSANSEKLFLFIYIFNNA